MPHPIPRPILFLRLYNNSGSSWSRGRRRSRRSWSIIWKRRRRRIEPRAGDCDGFRYYACRTVLFLNQSESESIEMEKKEQPFLTDVTELREKARASIDKGAVTPNYQGNVKQTIDILQNVLATEIVCVLRYTMNAVAAPGLSSESVKEEFDEHAKEEQEHMRLVAERINQLGGKPNFNPDGLASRAASQYIEGANLVAMIKENLIAERIACDHYQELIRYFADKDAAT